MQTVFTSDDEMEIKRLSNANNLAFCLWEIQNNVWRKFKHRDDGTYSYEDIWEEINECINDHNLNLDALV